MPILLFTNLKGGVAKTTSAVAVAECLASEGYRTLVIDADHQCMAGELLLGEDRLLRCEQSKSTLHDLLAEMLDDDFRAEQLPGYVIEKVSNIDGGLEKLSVLPCSIRIDDFQTNMAKAKRGYRSNDEFQRVYDRRKNLLRRWLSANYDFTIIDCPPSMPVQVKALLNVADTYIVPTVPDRLSVRGSLWLLDRVRRSGIKTPALGTLWSMVRVQTAMHVRVIEHTQRGEKPFDRLPNPFKTQIPNASAIAEATEPGKSPRSFSAKYTPAFAKLFHNLCEEIVQRSAWLAESENGTKVRV